MGNKELQKRIWKTRGVEVTESFTAKLSHQTNTLCNQPQKRRNIWRLP